MAEEWSIVLDSGRERETSGNPAERSDRPPPRNVLQDMNREAAPAAPPENLSLREEVPRRETENHSVSRRPFDALREASSGEGQRDTNLIAQNAQEQLDQPLGNNDRSSQREERSIPANQALEMRRRLRNWKASLHRQEDGMMHEQRHVPRESLRYVQLAEQIWSVKVIRNRIDYLSARLAPDREQGILRLDQPDVLFIQQDLVLLEWENKHLERCQRLQDDESGRQPLLPDERASLRSSLAEAESELYAGVRNMREELSFLEQVLRDARLPQEQRQGLEWTGSGEPFSCAVQLDLQIQSANFTRARMYLLHEQLDPNSAQPQELHWRQQKQVSVQHIVVLGQQSRNFVSRRPIDLGTMEPLDQEQWLSDQQRNRDVDLLRLAFAIMAGAVVRGPLP